MSQPMNNARERILGNIKTSLKVEQQDDIRKQNVMNRLLNKEKGIIPQRAQLKKRQQTELFGEMASKAQSNLFHVDNYQEIPKLVSYYLRKNNLPTRLKVGHDRRLAKAKWHSHPQLEVSQGPSDGNDLVGVSHAFAGIAETGTLIMCSGEDNPTTLNFLPDHHIVVIAAKDIKGDMETALAKLPTSDDGVTMPRAVNLITGPSRSGDIEQKLLLGAHGPRALNIIIVG